MELTEDEMDRRWNRSDDGQCKNIMPPIYQAVEA